MIQVAGRLHRSKLLGHSAATSVPRRYLDTHYARCVQRGVKQPVGAERQVLDREAACPPFVREVLTEESRRKPVAFVADLNPRSSSPACWTVFRFARSYRTPAPNLSLGVMLQLTDPKTLTGLAGILSARAIHLPRYPPSVAPRIPYKLPPPRVVDQKCFAKSRLCANTIRPRSGRQVASADPTVFAGRIFLTRLCNPTRTPPASIPAAPVKRRFANSDSEPPPVISSR